MGEGEHWRKFLGGGLNYPRNSENDTQKASRIQIIETHLTPSILFMI